MTTAHPSGGTRNLGRRLAGFCLRRILDRVDAALCRSDQLPAHGIHRVLVIRPNHRLGNTVLISPLLGEIEAWYPGAEIDVVSAGNAAKDLFSSRFQVRRIICLPRRIARHLPASVACLRSMRATHYDLAIDPCVGSHSGHLLLGMARADYKVGFASGDTAGMEHEAPSDLPDHLAKRGVYALRRALAADTSLPWPMLDAGLPSNELQDGQRALDRILGRREDAAEREGPVLGIFADATGDKRLPESWWNALVARLREIRPDVRIVNVLAAHGQPQLSGVETSFYTTDLRKLGAVVANMDGFVSADCGVMHLAAAGGTPTLGLFTRDNRGKYGPYGNHNTGLDVSIDDADANASGTSVAHLAAMAWIKRVIVQTSDVNVDDGRAEDDAATRLTRRASS